MGSQFLTPILWNWYSKSVEAQNYEILVEDSCTGRSSSITVRIVYLFAFQFWYWELCVKTDEGKAESMTLLTFALWGCFDCRWVTGGEVGQKILIRASWNRIFYSLLQLNSWSAKGASCHLAFVSNCPTIVTRVSPIYIADELNLRFYIFVLGLFRSQHNYTINSDFPESAVTWKRKRKNVFPGLLVKWNQFSSLTVLALALAVIFWYILRKIK